ncbi:MAG: stage VI sporulation protein F [Sporolactobacillus sp.]|nr:stage VI sporulation protein F [Sporolactobacillus sp.]MCI1883160.1 stage VI sporulation protein F [Sporolactobacillus sp.]
MNSNPSFFNNIEKKTQMKKEDIYAIADSVTGADFSNPEVVRQLIARIGRTAGVAVPKDKEEALIKAITSGNVPDNFSSLSKLFGPKQ